MTVATAFAVFVKAVDELEAERDQQRNEEEQKRCVACDFCAAFINVVIDAVGHIQHHSREDAPEENGSQPVNGAA
jgi:hypothetical protein